MGGGAEVIPYGKFIRENGKEKSLEGNIKEILLKGFDRYPA